MSTYQRFFGVAASLAGLCGVGLGAFAAHALRARLEPAMLAAFQTGVLYQLLHAVTLMAVALHAAHLAEPWAKIACGAFLLGMVLFSGSLYILSTTSWRAVGAVTPLGGLALLGGWLSLAWAVAQAP